MIEIQLSIEILSSFARSCVVKFLFLKFKGERHNFHKNVGKTSDLFKLYGFAEKYYQFINQIKEMFG